MASVEQDRQLLAKAAVLKCEPMLRRYFARRLHASPQDADDLAQEVFFRFLKFGSSPIADSQSYLFGIARNVLADFYRRRREAREVSLDEVVDPSGDIELASRNATDPAELLCQMDVLASQMARLPASHRRVLLAHEGEGYSYREVAQRLGFSIQTVEKYLTLAKTQLRAMATEPRRLR